MNGGIGLNLGKENTDMNALIQLTARALNSTPQKVIRASYAYANRLPSEAEQKQIVNTILREMVPMEVEDFCLDVLSGRIHPRI